MSERGVKTPYIRGIHFVDKIMNKALKNGYNEKDEYELFKTLSYQAHQDRLFLFDLNFSTRTTISPTIIFTL